MATKVKINVTQEKKIDYTNANNYRRHCRPRCLLGRDRGVGLKKNLDSDGQTHLSSPALSFWDCTREDV